MRVRVSVFTAAHAIPWEELHRPGRALVYSLLRQADPKLAEHLHAEGWGPAGMAPFGFCPPVFPQAGRRRGVYAAGGHGWLEIGSPVTAVARAIARGLQDRVGGYIDWGGVALRVNHAEVIGPPPGLARGRATWETATPVVVKTGDPRAGTPVWLLPGEAGWEGRVGGNGRRKAATLRLPPDFVVRRVLWAGPRRGHVVAPGADGRKVGARVRVAVAGHPDVLRALWCWGLGEATSAGMGWITA